MKNVSLLVGMMIVFFCFSTITHAGFDWGEGSGECSGEGSFQQNILQKAVILVGEIPSGKQDVYIKLNSDKDVDIQLYDKNTGNPIVGWNIGAPIGDYPNDNLEVDYAGVEIEYSGYNGDGSGKGHEYIRLTGTLNRTLVMKAYGYNSGYATVNYSWEGTQGCSDGGKPAESGSGTFQQQITHDDIVEVGDLIPGLNNVYIELISNEDVDIQLYDGSTKIVHWPSGILNDSSYQSTNYGGMIIEWSGYNGDGSGKGHEYIRITGSVDRVLTMKAFGFNAGYATVNYSWGGNSNNSNSISDISITKNFLQNSWQINGVLIDSNGNGVSNYTIGVHDPIKLQSTIVSTTTNGSFSYITYRSFGELPSGIYQVEFLDGQEILDLVQIITDEQLVLNFWDNEDVQTNTFEVQLSNNSNFPITTIQLYSNMLLSNSTPETYFESEEQKKGVLHDLTDNFIDGFVDANFSWSDAGFYVITGVATGAACSFTGGAGCPVALGIAAHAIAGHVAVDNIELIANSGNDALLENGYIDETQNTYIRRTIIGGKVVYSVITLSHDVGSHAANIGDVVALNEHLGTTGTVMVGATWAAYDVYSDAMSAVEILKNIDLVIEPN